MALPGNVLLITLDQLRADSVGYAGHPLVRTPNLDALAAGGVRFTNHFAQTAPCGPSRATIHTGLYQMNHRSVANGTPLDDRFTNIAREARKIGYAPALFGYTDTTVDPRVAKSADDARLWTWESVLDGYDSICHLDEKMIPWGRWLESLGYDVPDPVERIYAPAEGGHRWAPARFAAEHSETAFLADEVLAWLDREEENWFAHVSFLRPHPPFVAPAPYHDLIDPADVSMPVGSPEASAALHPWLERMVHVPGVGASRREETLRRVRAVYYGLIAEVDHHLGRVLDGLKARGMWEDTLIVLTCDHGEQLGDHGLQGKIGFFDESFRVPAVVRDPRAAADATRGAAVSAFTENVDVLPTILEWIGADIPLQSDGRSLAPWTAGPAPAPGEWRTAAHFEFDYRFWPIAHEPGVWPRDRQLEALSLCVLRDESGKYVQFADGSALFFDLAADPQETTSRLEHRDAFAYAQRMLAWRMTHMERVLSGVRIDGEGIRGRLPELAWR